MPNRKSRKNPKNERRSKRKSKAYDRAGAVSATRGGGDALRDARNKLPLLGNQFEDKKMLYYEYGINLAGVAGILDTHYISANAVYDPDITGTGHQPIGFDQAMLFYEQWVVFRSVITVTFLSNSVTSTLSRCGVFLNPDTVNPSIYQVMENGYMKSAVITGTGGTSAGAHAIKKVSLSCDSVAYFNSKTRNDHFMRDVFSGTAAANCAEQVYFALFAFNAASATTYDIYCDVEISYDVRFWEPRKLSVSMLKALGEALADDGKGKPNEVDEWVKIVKIDHPEFNEKQFSREELFRFCHATTDSQVVHDAKWTEIERLSGIAKSDAEKQVMDIKLRMQEQATVPRITPGRGLFAPVTEKPACLKVEEPRVQVTQLCKPDELLALRSGPTQLSGIISGPRSAASKALPFTWRATQL